MLSRKLLMGTRDGVRYLYRQGNLYTAFTGGWNASIAFSPTHTKVTVNIGGGSSAIRRLPFQSYNFAGYADGADCWSVYELAYPYCPAEFTVNAIDMTPWNKLCMEFEMSNITAFGYNNLRFGAFTSRTAYTPNSYGSGTDSSIAAVMVNTNAGGRRTAEVSLANVYQQGYVGVYFTCATITQTSPAPDLKIYSIWLE